MAVIRRTRRTKGRAGQVDELKSLVNTLIKENAKLKRQIANLESETVGRATTAVTRGVASIARKIERALASATTRSRPARRAARASSGRRARTSASPRLSTPRKPASPEVQVKRLEALAKARQARAAKKAEATTAAK